MTGPEHYKAAEGLIRELSKALETVPRADVALVLDQAQVHATLALAAATAMSRPDMADEDFLAWDRACGEQP